MHLDRPPKNGNPPPDPGGRSTFAQALHQVTTNRQDLASVRRDVVALADEPDHLQTAGALRIHDGSGSLTFETLVEAIGIDRQALGFLRLAWAEAATWVDRRRHVWAATVAGPEWPGLLDATWRRASETQSEAVSGVIAGFLGDESPLRFPGLVREVGEIPVGSAIRAVQADSLVLDRAIEALGYLLAVAHSTIPRVVPKPTVRPVKSAANPGPIERIGTPFAQKHPDPRIHRWATDPDGERQGGQGPSIGEEEQNSRSDPDVA